MSNHQSRPYRVTGVDGRKHSFTSILSAITAAQREYNSSWVTKAWTVQYRSDRGATLRRYDVDEHGIAGTWTFGFDTTEPNEFYTGPREKLVELYGEFRVAKMEAKREITRANLEKMGVNA